MTTDQATKAGQSGGHAVGPEPAAGPAVGQVAPDGGPVAGGYPGGPVPGAGQVGAFPGGPVLAGGPVAGQVPGVRAGPSAGPGALTEAPARSRPRRSAGGRWLIWCLRAVVWAILLLIGYRGVVAIVTGGLSSGPGAAGRHAGAPGTGGAGSAPAGSGRASTPVPASPGPGSAGLGERGPAIAGPISGSADGFPVTLAQAYALDFGQAYLNFSPASAGRRAAALAPFLPPGTNPQLGYDGKGTQTLQSEQVAATHVMSAHVAVVTLLAEVNGRLIELGVPIYASGGAMVVSGKPALLPPPAKATIPAARARPGDRTAEAELARQLPAFFRAFAGSGVVRSPSLISGPNEIGGLNGVVTFDGIAGVSAPVAGGARRQVTVTVIWRTPGQVKVRTSTIANIPATIAMTYAMTVVRHNGNWHVESIGASTPAAG